MRAGPGVRGYANIDLGRAQAATDALAGRGAGGVQEEACEETLWIDSDVAFLPDDVEKLRAHNLPLVCGIYPKKGARELAAQMLPGTKSLVFGKEGGLVEILYAATGFLLVRREVYEKVQRDLKLPVCNTSFGRPMVPYFMPLIVETNKGPWYLIEDYAFCERARQVGYKVFADTTLRLGHIGSYEYGWEDAGSTPPRYATYRFRLGE